MRSPMFGRQSILERVLEEVLQLRQCYTGARGGPGEMLTHKFSDYHQLVTLVAIVMIFARVCCLVLI